ncbi:MAG: hypothetical protein OXK78_13880 [Caldilineaceae bacterium]|nr:hypothetical protein [Caldilineaceae bacterium]
MTLRSTAANLRKSLRAVKVRLRYPSPQKRFSPTQKLILRTMLNGATLKSHRYLDGRKEFRLHPLNGDASQVTVQDVRGLEDLGLLLSNHKFPAATLFLSQRGRRAAANE